MDYKKMIENNLIELRQALEKGRAVVEASDAEGEEKKRILDYIGSFDVRFTELEKYLADVYSIFVQKNELIQVYGNKLHEAYEEIARLNIDNKGLEDSLMCGIDNIREEDGKL